MSFQLFCFKSRRFVGTMIRLGRNGVMRFFIDQMNNELSALSDAFESNRDNWTLEQSEIAETMMDDLCANMELQSDWNEYTSSSEVMDETGVYCLN